MEKSLVFSMNETKALLDAGELDEAIARATAAVKAQPTDAASRTLLFELLSIGGEWERALKQLDVIAHGDAVAEIGIQVYRNNIAASHLRERLFAEGVAPHFFSEPPAYVDRHLAAINAVRGNEAEQARELLDEAEEMRPSFAGRADGAAFDDFRDADDRTAPVIEAIVSDKYTWIPFEQIELLEVRQPQQLRDLVWCPAHVELKNGTIGEVFLFALYQGSHEHNDMRVRLGRMTDWEPIGDVVERGVGLKLFLAGDADKSLFELQRIKFDEAEAGE